MDAVSILFNRAILDLVAGSLVLFVFNLLVEMLFGLDLNNMIVGSNTPIPIGLALMGAFLLGHLVDKVAFLLLDHFLFAKHFQTRSATFDLPDWCQTMIEGKIEESLTILPSRSGDLVDDSKADWITAVFLTKARQELLLKRADLIANFQFVSNLLTIFFFALFVIPPYLFFRLNDIRYTVGSIPILLLICVGYWRFSVASLRRINTFENLVVYGMLLEEKREQTDELSATEHVGRELSAEEGAIPRIMAILFGKRGRPRG